MLDEDQLFNMEEMSPAKYIEKQVIIYSSPFLLLLATVGNILVCLVMCRLCQVVWSSCVYIAILAILDLCIVYTWCGNEWLSEVGHIDISNMLTISSQSVCKVYNFILNSIYQMEKWLTVCLSIECFIAAKYPKRAFEMCTLSRAKAIILLLTVIMSCLNIHYFWTFSVINLKELSTELDMPDLLMCSFVEHGVPFSKVFQEVAYPIIDVLVAQVFPFTLVTLFCSLSIYYIKKGPRLADMMEDEWRKKYLLYPEGMNELKTAIIVIGFVSLLSLPKLLIICFRQGALESMEAEFKLDLAETITKMLEYIHLSAKFFILLCTCKHFRQELYRSLRSICRCRTNMGDTDPHKCHKNGKDIDPLTFQRRQNVIGSKLSSETEHTVV